MISPPIFVCVVEHGRVKASGLGFVAIIVGKDVAQCVVGLQASAPASLDTLLKGRDPKKILPLLRYGRRAPAWQYPAYAPARPWRKSLALPWPLRRGPLPRSPNPISPSDNGCAASPGLGLINPKDSNLLFHRSAFSSQLGPRRSATNQPAFDRPRRQGSKAIVMWLNGITSGRSVANYTTFSSGLSLTMVRDESGP